MILKDQAILLYESYEKHPFVRTLLHALNIMPGLPEVDTVISNYIKNLKTEKLKLFFDELSTGTVELTENIIESNDFLHSYFSTVNYVVRTRSDEKVKRFACILKSLAYQRINADEFDDYIAILNELSEREFTILALKYKYELGFLPEIGETEYRSNGEVQNPKQITNLYWKRFSEEIINKLNLEEDEFSSLLIRLQRTGCYVIHKGYYDSKNDHDGNTTALFKKIYSIIYDSK